jgi:ATP-dependent DNA helicase DinG
MLTADEKTLIAAAYHRLQELLPGFRPREQQKQMMQFAASTLGDGATGLVDAPTGTGKTLSYLIPSLVLAHTRDRRLVVSTATAALQDQLADKDLPLVCQVMQDIGLGVTRCAVAKGRERYVCPLALQNHTAQSSLLDEASTTQVLHEIRSTWESGQWDGVRDTLPMVAPQEAWKKIRNDRHACTKERCPQYKHCPFFANAERIDQGHVIVTNHDYLLAMLVNSDHSPVCDFEKNFYVLDEAHHFADKCIEAFAHKALINPAAASEYRVYMRHLSNREREGFEFAAAQVSGLASAINNAINAMAGDNTTYRFTFARLPNLLEKLLNEYAQTLTRMHLELEDAITEFQKSDAGKRFAAQFVLQQGWGLTGQLAEQIEAVEEFVEQSEHGRAKWVTKGRDGWCCHVCPFDAAKLANSIIWQHTKGVLLTSATLAPDGDFNSVLRSLGLPKDTATAKLDSPLNFSRSKLWVPRVMPSSSQSGMHGRMVVAYLRSLVFASDAKGALVYFTSKTQMNKVFDWLDADEQALVLMQGQWAPSAMIEEHKARIQAGKRSILFGLDSMSEGVDLPGDYCTKVVMAKLPFPSPDDPVLAAHAEFLEEKGINPFPLLMVPRAARKVAQVVGRLIRTEDDWGDVYVLDRRLVSKSYGSRLLKATPFREIAAC